MRILILAIIFQLFHNLGHSLNITIVSSQPVSTGNDMDSVWMEVASNMGHNAIIVPQSTLTNNLFFSSTDILIVSSATIGLLNDEEDVILEFLKTGKPVYLQTEYNPYLTTNVAFKFIVGALGGEFSWQNMFSYEFDHVNVLGSYSNTPNDVQSINFFFHSISGKGDCNTIPFLEHAGEFHGFQYIPENQDFGSIITITDQDWIWERTSLPLMENILMHLISPPAIPEENKIDLGKDTVLCVGDALVLELEALSEDFEWQDNSNLSFYTVTQAGDYWVSANLNCGLVSDSISISTEYCNCKLYLPNIFSPEDNGLNDIFNP